MKIIFMKTLPLIIIFIISTCIATYGLDIDKKVLLSDLVLKINDLNVHIDDDVKLVIASLGDDYTFDEANSCAYKGMDKSFSYDGIIISTLPIDGKDVICEIFITSDKYETSRGVKIGQKKSYVENVYGENYTLEDGVLTYWIGEENNPKSPKLYFTLDDEDLITGISIFSAKNSGR